MSLHGITEQHQIGGVAANKTEKSRLPKRLSVAFLAEVLKPFSVRVEGHLRCTSDLV
ncbi:hypothetical protein Plhal304r1_c027g0089651 [Plasmopara halstedii]